MPPVFHASVLKYLWNCMGPLELVCMTFHSSASMSPSIIWKTLKGKTILFKGGERASKTTHIAHSHYQERKAGNTYLLTMSTQSPSKDKGMQG